MKLLILNIKARNQVVLFPSRLAFWRKIKVNKNKIAIFLKLYN